MDLSELEAQARTDLPLAGVPTDGEYIDEDEQMSADIIEGIALLATSRTLLEYLANPTLCKGITKRERDTMGRLSENIRGYLCEVEPTYNEVD